MKRGVFISIGSNVGDRAENLKEAVRMLAEDPEKIRLIKESSFYETSAWGKTNQRDFFNCAVEIETSLSPGALLDFLKEIEKKFGRTPEGRWAERPIDLDIVLYGGEVLEEEGLTIPHPYAHERAFVLAPLAEIAPKAVHPVFGKTIAELASSVKDTLKVSRIDS
ncbi:MAG: 2-amino-4-hydroxy-6-hydroxymethyldihydropteridine diphosphokinase [Thermodesulfobacteriota bacterium]